MKSATRRSSHHTTLIITNVPLPVMNLRAFMMRMVKEAYALRYKLITGAQTFS